MIQAAATFLETATSARDVTDAAMLVRCTIRCWTGVRRDRRVTESVIAAHNAEHGAGKFDKRLVDPKALRGVQGVAGVARAFLYENSLPWGETEGDRILPAANFQRFFDGISDLKSRYQGAVQAFLAVYAQEVERSRQRLGDMFDEDEYPEPDFLATQFDFDTAFRPMPKAADFRVRLSQATVDLIRADIEARNKRDVELAMRDLWDRVHEQVGSLVAQIERIEDGSVLADGSRRSGYVDTRTVANIEGLIDLLPRLNVTGDPGLERAYRILREKVQGNSPSDYKDNPAARRAALAAADEIVALMGGVPMTRAA
jgi:hypothetical protein